MAPRLQLKMLSKSGELLNCINCFPGQITVFRAFSDQELLPYQRALSGGHGAERFSVLLDNKEYLPHDQFLIGFGERLPVDKTLEEYLASCNAPEGAVSGLLISYGMDQFQGKNCASLSECAARRTQILAATFSSAPVLVMNSPFEPISAQWKERFADLLLSDTLQKQRLCVITRLDYRPQGWIGNELVIRIQVGENIQKTIGFAGGQSDVAMMVNQVRELLKDEKVVQQVIDSQKLKQPPPVEPTAPTAKIIVSQALQKENLTSRYERHVSTPLEIKPNVDLLSSGGLRIKHQMRPLRKIALATASLSILLLLAVSAISYSRGGQKGAHIAALGNPTQTQSNQSENNIVQPVKAVVDTTKKSQQNGSESKVQKPPLSENKNPVQIVEIAKPPEVAPPPPPSELLLDHYPPEIKVALLNAFSNDTQPITLRNPGAVEEIKVKKSSRELNPFEALRGLSNSSISSKTSTTHIGEDFAPPNTGAAQSESDIERHERIRQKFLDAINRAVEEKQANEG